MTPKLAIVAYPNFSETGRTTIQAIRAQHDPQFAMLAPHFTLVFPVEAPLIPVINEAQAAAHAGAPFSVTLRSVLAVRDVFGIGGHVFLVPERGADEVAALNSRLYSGVLNWAHRVDIPYVPHITVAASSDFSECEVLAAALSRDRWDMSGSVDALCVVEMVGDRVAMVAELPLGGGKRSA